jgi:hypothetical protein
VVDELLGFVGGDGLRFRSNIGRNDVCGALLMVHWWLEIAVW